MSKNGMYNVVVLDFISQETFVAAKECTWKKAKKIKKRSEKRDRFCSCVIVPICISVSLSMGEETIGLNSKTA